MKRKINLQIVCIIALMVCMCGCGKSELKRETEQVPETIIEETAENEMMEAVSDSTDAQTPDALSDTTEQVFSEGDESVSEETDDTIGSEAEEYPLPELSQEEKDAIHSAERLAAAKPFEKDILEEFKEAYAQNDRVVGHIFVEGTDIDCPVLQTIENYDFYLTHDLDGAESKQGCIILDPDSEIGIGTKETGYLEGYEPSTNQLVHGHNMKSGTMFGSLDAYAKMSYAKKHPYIQFDSLYEHRTYEVVLAFYSKVYPEEEEVFKYYNFNQADTNEEFSEWYRNIQELALYQRDIEVSYGDEMITLSTCAYQEEDGRFAVVGKRIK